MKITFNKRSDCFSEYCCVSGSAAKISHVDFYLNTCFLGSLTFTCIILLNIIHHSSFPADKYLPTFLFRLPALFLRRNLTFLERGSFQKGVWKKSFTCLTPDNDRTSSSMATKEWCSRDYSVSLDSGRVGQVPKKFLKLMETTLKDLGSNATLAVDMAASVKYVTIECLQE